MTKEQIIEAVRQLPDNVQLEDVFERLLFIQQLEERIALCEQAGTSVSFEEAQRRTSGQLHAA